MLKFSKLKIKYNEKGLTIINIEIIKYLYKGSYRNTLSHDLQDCERDLVPYKANEGLDQSAHLQSEQGLCCSLIGY